MPVARVGDLVCGFVVVSSLGINSMAELVAYAKANPGKLSFGTAGLGSTSHIRLAMLNWLAKTDITLVPYRGSGDALNDLLSGQIQMMNEITPIPHVKTGKLKMLAMNYPTRHWDFPDVPTLTEIGYPDADVPTWFAIFAPAGTAPEIIAAFSAAASEIGRSPEMIARMREINVAIPVQTPAEIAKFRDADSAANAKLIKDANIKME
jgi:tripartite-type tricarboxylate transporter receptor subunit TctC